MATTESRSGFRLPWSADRAQSGDASEGNPESEPRTDAPAPAAPGVEVAEALEPTSDPDGQTVAEANGGVPDVVAPVPDAAPTARPGPAAPGPPIAARIPAPAQGRRPTKFLTDLTHAMQVAAEQARAATLDQFRVEGSAYVEQIQGRSIADADALRRRADDDVAGIKDWSKAEIARIREQTESQISGRRGQLDEQLARHAALVGRDVARIESRIASFEAEMAAFFDELLAETDLTILAARAQQMPEPPAFDELDDTDYAALMAEPGIGIPAAEAEPIATSPTTAEADAGPADLDPATAAINAAADAAAAVEAATAEAERAEAAADRAESAAGHDADLATDATGSDAQADTAPAEPPDAAGPGLPDAPGSEPDGDVTESDPRLAMLGLAPDFAAAEAAAAEAAAAETSEIPELDEQNLAARLAGLVPSSRSGSAADSAPAGPTVSTQVVVTGLVSVASIASLKRHLSRQAGVRHVGVSSGPDGEFVFTVQHEAEVSLRDVIPTLPGFQARVTGGGNGIVTASAHDPED